MKKISALVLSVLILISISGCKEEHKDPVAWTEDASGTTIRISEDGRVSYPEEIPYSVPYNDTVVTLQRVQHYEHESNFSHRFFTVITLDLSKLDAAQIHWLTESDMRFNVYLTHEKNKYDFTEMRYLGNLLDENTGRLYYVCISHFDKEDRYSFADAELVVNISINQEETYEHTGEAGTRQLPKTETMLFKSVVPDRILDVEAIPHPLYDFILKWIENDIAHAVK